MKSPKDTRRLTLRDLSRPGPLLVIDDQPLRGELGRELKTLHRSYERLRREINHHQTVVRPAYQTWYYDRFGERASLVERLRADFEQKTMLLKRMRDYYTWRGFTRQRAFAQASGDLEALKAMIQEEEFEEDLSEEEELIADDEAEDIITWAPPVEEPEPATSAEIALAREIKLYYRRLAQALHPDRLSEGPTATLRQLWQETQEAYAAADLDRLKAVWTECLFAIDPFSGEVRVAELQTAGARLRARIRELQKTKRELAKTDPTWQFEKRSKELLAREISVELMEAETDLRSSIRGLDREIKAFSGARHESTASL